MKAVVIVAIMVGAVYFSASRDFENYVREFERERFEKLQEYWRMNIQILKAGRQIFFTLNCQTEIKLKDMVSFGVIKS